MAAEDLRTIQRSQAVNASESESDLDKDPQDDESMCQIIEHIEAKGLELICDEEIDYENLPEPTPEKFDFYYEKCQCFDNQAPCLWKKLGCAKEFMPVIGCGVAATLLRLCNLEPEDIPDDKPYFKKWKGELR